jgi:hypothetical protein
MRLILPITVSVFLCICPPELEELELYDEEEENTSIASAHIGNNKQTTLPTCALEVILQQW